MMVPIAVQVVLNLPVPAPDVQDTDIFVSTQLAGYYLFHCLMVLQPVKSLSLGL